MKMMPLLRRVFDAQLSPLVAGTPLHISMFSKDLASGILRGSCKLRARLRGRTKGDKPSPNADFR